MLNGDVVIGSATADSNGDFSITSAALADGVYTLTVKSTDSAGNSSESTIAITIDTSEPTIEYDDVRFIVSGSNVDLFVPQVVLNVNNWIHEMKVYFSASDRVNAKNNAANINTNYFDEVNTSLTTALGYVLFKQDLNAQKQIPNTSISNFLTSWSNMPTPTKVEFTLSDKQGAPGVSINTTTYSNTTTPPTVWVLILLDLLFAKFRCPFIRSSTSIR